jgi:DNA-binding HxlR family transcriptional regulator
LKVKLTTDMMALMTTSLSDKLPERSCGIAATLDVVGDRWSLLIVREILFGNRRFQGMVEQLGVPRDRLTARLRFLIEAQVLEQRTYQSAPPRSEYYLTPSGLELATVLVALFDWGKRWGHVADDGVVLHHREHTLRPSLICDDCGEAVGWDGLTRELSGNAGTDFMDVGSAADAR